MQKIEPFYNWRHLYIASKDRKSPFFGYNNSEVFYTHSLYNFVIHPQWDSIDSETLFAKILYVNYQKRFAIIELLGEWNDCINNDIMLLKTNIIDCLIYNKINHFIIIGENILNFHFSDDCYYEEWYNEINKGWITLINFKQHVLDEMNKVSLHSFMNQNKEWVNWRTFNPNQLYNLIEQKAY